MRHLILLPLLLLAAGALTGCNSVREVGPVIKKMHFPGGVHIQNTPNGPLAHNQPDRYALVRRVTLSDGSQATRTDFVEYAEWLDARVEPEAGK